MSLTSLVQGSLRKHPPVWTHHIALDDELHILYCVFDTRGSKHSFSRFFNLVQQSRKRSLLYVVEKPWKTVLWTHDVCYQIPVYMQFVVPHYVVSSELAGAYVKRLGQGMEVERLMLSIKSRWSWHYRVNATCTWTSIKTSCFFYQWFHCWTTANLMHAKCKFPTSKSD